MAIRPTDLQTSFNQTLLNPPIEQRVEEGPRAVQNAAQAQFVAHTEERNERVAESTEAKGNRIEVGERAPDREAGGKGRKRERKPGDPFEETVDDAAGLTDDGTPHLIDFTA
jgi:hypothetical protein